jgi:hypothetical protein
MSSSKPIHLKALHTGSIASQLIQHEFQGIILGVTSRGVFIKTDTRWLLFISSEHFPGPLTINVPSLWETGIKLSPGTRVNIRSRKISFPGTELVITAQPQSDYHQKLPSYQTLTISARQEKLEEAARYVIDSHEVSTAQILLHCWLPRLPELPYDAGSIPKFYEQMTSLDRDPNGLYTLNSLSDLIGAGPGLTPSGDDFMIGYLLVVNRWGHLLAVLRKLTAFNQQVVSTAYKRTTGLSSNLIECASRGMADQRLIDALDYLVSDSGQDLQVIDALLTWGSSSGLEVFLGFVAALSETNPAQPL